MPPLPLGPSADRARFVGSFAVRVVDHFFQEPVAEELLVSFLDPSKGPSKGPSGRTTRHHDGSYRFVDYPAGNHDLSVTSQTGNWVSWVGPQAFVVPMPGMQTVEVWPTAKADAPKGHSVIRGRLQGTGVVGLSVQFGAPPVSFSGHYTRADDDQEFLYVLPTSITANPASGMLDVVVRVDGGARPVVSVVLDTVTIPGNNFSIPPGRELRLFIAVGP